MQKELKSAAAELLEVGRLRWHKLRLAAREGAHSILLGALTVLVGSVAAVLATVLLILGLVGGLSDLAGDRLWVGRLLIGGAVLALAVLALRNLRTKMRRLFVEDLRSRAPLAKQPQGANQ